MLRLEDFAANVVKSGLVPPEVLARARAELAAGRGRRRGGRTWPAG